MIANSGILVEQELHKLQRQYRIMDTERKAYSEESRLLIKKQRSSIDQLKRDNEYLLDELKLIEQRLEDTKKNGSQSKKAEVLQEQLVAQTIANLDAQITHLNKTIAEQREAIGGMNSSTQISQATQKQIRILENRLDKAFVKFNKALAVNKKMRAVIDNLRRERMVFGNVYRKFEKELGDQKKYMAEIIESSNSAYEARDEAQAKIVALKEKAEKEYQAYIQEIKELDRTLEQDRKLKSFLATKAADRLGENINADGPKKLKRLYSISCIESLFCSNSFSVRNNNELEKTVVAKSSQDLLSDTVSNYEKAFATIKQVTGVNDIDELVHRFKDVEDQNFSLFNYVNEINNEIEKLHEEINAIKREMSVLEIENASLEEQNKKIMKELETKLQHVTSKCELYEKKYTEATEIIETLSNGVERLTKAFHNTQTTVINTSITNSTLGNPPPLGSTSPDAVSSSVIGSGSHLGSPTSPTSPTSPAVSTTTTITAPFTVSDRLLNTTVNDNSLISFFGLIEQKTNDLLVLHYLTAHPKKLGSAGPNGAGLVPGGNTGNPNQGVGDDDKPIAMGGIGGLASNGPTAPMGVITIQAPSTGDNDTDGEDEEEERPLTREELANKTMKGV
ncbi:hypothetical protein BKA69DRAFT_1041689 [Paraphysoderma sedebokerense]|nr:hypothetical protein BKA69DRAFT_1041689 [Paraphysoderma sedebokerense]